ncbi:MAG: hypothetical protein HQL41_19660, partial [Alphaproteobacteria bacterium]|nr:hypothetical protein [Alphaproteobacteria bacterium]
DPARVIGRFALVTIGLPAGDGPPPAVGQPALVSFRVSPAVLLHKTTGLDWFR